MSHTFTPLPLESLQVTALEVNGGGRDASVTAIDPGSMSQFLVPDGTWALMAPLLQLMQRKPTDCRQPIRNRATIIGLIFVLRTGLRWEIQRSEMGCSFRNSYRRRLHHWHMAIAWVAMDWVML